MTTATSLASLLPSLVIVPLTLLPIINPLSGAPVFMATAGRDPQTIAKLARQVAINCWFILVGSMLVGTYVLDFFGISATEIRSACLLLRIPRDRHPELLENVRLMSRAACKMLSERRGT